MASPEKVRVACPRCGATNNFPMSALGKTVVCGRCKNALPEPGTVVEPEPQYANTLFQNSVLPVLVDFYSPTCGPCLMMHPIMESFARRKAGEIMVVRLNVDRHPEMAASHGVMGVPTFIIFLKGAERGRTSGAMSEADLSLWVASRI
jgi:thioredoxin 2